MPVAAEWLGLLATTAVPLLQLLALVVAGIVLYRLRLLDELAVDRLVRLVVSVTLPCLIIGKVVLQFRPYTLQFAHWYILPAAAGLMVLAAGLVSGLVGRWTAPAKHRRAFRVICTFHNAGYLNIPIVAALYGPGQRYGISADQMLVVLFLFILGISPLMWSLGVRWLRADASGPATHSRWRIRQMISPPFLANAVAVSLCLLDLPPRISPAVLQRVLAPVQWTGACTIPLMMLVLGGILAGLRPDQRLARGSVLAAAVMRFLLLPALGLAVLMWLLERGWLSKAYAVILFLQTMMPTATGMAVAARRYGTPATSEYVGGTVFALYVASIGAIPAWLAVWGLMVGFQVP